MHSELKPIYILEKKKTCTDLSAEEEMQKMTDISVTGPNVASTVLPLASVGLHLYTGVAFGPGVPWQQGD